MKPILPVLVGPLKPASRQGSELRAHLKNIIQNEALMQASDFDAARSRAVCYGNRLSLIRDHQTAPVHWAEGILSGKLSYYSRLLHADLHPDTHAPSAVVDSLLFGADGLPLSPQKLCAEAARVVKVHDSYPDLCPEEGLVRLGIDLKLVGEFVHIIPGDDNDFAAEELPVPSRTMTLAAALKGLKFDHRRTDIGDLDLDFFSLLQTMPYARQADLDRDLTDLVRLYKLADPGIVTVAFSPVSTNGLIMYNSRSLDENVEIVARLIEELEIDARQPRLIDEPRRDGRFSPK